MTRSRAEIGKANRRKGATVELAVVKWLRANGFPHAERAVRTGYANGSTSGADPGDISGCPGLVIQVTDRADIGQDAVLAVRLGDTERQRIAARADYGLLVAKRRGVADPGRWPVHLDGWEFASLCVDERRGRLLDRFECVVATTLGEIVPILRARGYGEPLEEKA